MKSLLTILLICFCFVGYGQHTAIKEWKDNSGKLYHVNYVYGDMYFVPSILILDDKGNEVEPPHHYYAKVTVSLKDKQIGDIMNGMYVKEGCFEDVPEMWVKRAYELQKIIDSNNHLRIVNGANAKYKYTVTWTTFDVKYISKEYGVDIKSVNHSQIFYAKNDANDFVNKEYRKLDSGVDYKIDSVLIKKNK